MQVQILIPGREDAFENYALAVKASGGVPVFWVGCPPASVQWTAAAWRRRYRSLPVWPGEHRLHGHRPGAGYI